MTTLGKLNFMAGADRRNMRVGLSNQPISSGKTRVRVLNDAALTATAAPIDAYRAAARSHR